MSAAMVPGLLEHVKVKRYGSRLAVEDPVRRLRIGIDDLTLEVLQELAGGPMPPDELAAAVGGEPAEIRVRVELLTRHGLLATPRAAELLALAEQARPLWPAEESTEAPLTFPDGLAHGCIACGSCCMGTDIGPLRDQDIERVREIDWTPHLPDDVTPDDWLTEHEVGGRVVTLMGRRDNRCVFLGEDKLCVIHKVAGPQQKPTICRQFPYTFTRTPDGIAVSFSMECRSWWKARQRGEPVSEDVAGIRELLAGGAPIVDLHLPVAVDDGLDWSLERWLEVRAEILAGLRASTDLAGIVEALRAPLLAALEADRERWSAGEAFVAPAAWGVAEENDAALNFAPACEVMQSELARSLGELAERYRDAGDDAEADRVERVVWTFDNLLQGRRLSDMGRFEHETDIWRDAALAAVYAHDPARAGDLVFGLACLVQRIVAGHRLSALLARAALRVRTEEQDVVDSMVLLTKMLRGQTVVGMLRRLREPIVHLFLQNPHVFSGRAEPIGGLPWPGRR